MRRSLLFIALVVSLVGLAMVFWRERTAKPDGPRVELRAGQETAPVCPWREPASDLHKLFAPATNYVVEARIVSRSMAEIETRLGRHMTADENPMRLHRVQHEGRRLGSVLVTRVKGEHGSIEMVIGLETNRQVRGVLIQSHREPDPVAADINALLPAFVGKSASSPLRLGEDLPSVAPESRASAQAVADGVRDQLLVFSYADLPAEVTQTGHPAHP
jgi:hypothetical protein